MKKEYTKVSSGGFFFCRIGVMILIWLAYLFQIKELVLLSFFILLLSAILTVKFAPMILLWDYTIGLLIKTKKEYLHVKAMRFAHIAGTILSLICIILLYTKPAIGWNLVLIFAIIKSISALGFCPASKLYTCMNEGGCCALISKPHKTKPHKSKK